MNILKKHDLLIEILNLLRTKVQVCNFKNERILTDKFRLLSFTGYPVKAHVLGLSLTNLRRRFVRPIHPVYMMKWNNTLSASLVISTSGVHEQYVQKAINQKICVAEST